ncbi:MAG: hypothetical protein JXQ29_15215 [Planctomycetes bacterium]|nr:hypothetical protein [Planctomycetota bacterium]
MRALWKALLSTTLALAVVILVERFVGGGPAPRTIPALLVAAAVALAAGLVGAAFLLLVFGAAAARRFAGRARRNPMRYAAPAATFGAAYLVAVPGFRAAIGSAGGGLLLVCAALAAAIAGHCVAGTFAQVSRRSGPEPGAPGRFLRERMGALALALVLALLGAWLLAPELRPTLQADASLPLRVAPDLPGGRFVCVLVDGVTPEELADVGAAFGPGDLIPFEAGGRWLPPTFWWTVVTGHPPPEHGMWGAPCRSGMVRQDSVYAAAVQAPWADSWEALAAFVPVPGVVSARPRAARIKSVWEVASETGRTVGVVNLWFTWPVPRVRRFSVSDAALQVLAARDPASAAATAAGSLAGLLWPEDDAGWREVVVQRARLASASASQPPSGGTRDRFAVEMTLAALDRFRPPPDVLLVRLSGPDCAGLAPEADERGRQTALQSLAAALFELRSVLLLAESTVLLLGHPGASGQGDTAALWINRGGAFRTQAIPLAPCDFAPSLLHGLGIPLSRELRGRPRGELLPAASGDRPSGWVTTYGRSVVVPLRPPGSLRPRSPDLPYLSR